MKDTPKVELRKIKSMKSMMKSIFCYGTLRKTDSYLDSSRKELSKELFAVVYDEYSKYLTKTYDINQGTYTDHEGCTYNELVKK